MALTGEASREEFDKAVRGDYALVYLSPERLEGAQTLLQRIKDTVGIVCFAVDECVRAVCVAGRGRRDARLTAMTTDVRISFDTTAHTTRWQVPLHLPMVRRYMAYTIPFPYQSHHPPTHTPIPPIHNPGATPSAPPTSS